MLNSELAKAASLVKKRMKPNEIRSFNKILERLVLKITDSPEMTYSMVQYAVCTSAETLSES